jgi:hypothetical protein
MSLLDTQNGRDILQSIVATYLTQRRMSRRLKRSFYIAFKDWEAGNGFDLETLLNDLNDTDESEIEKLNELLVQFGFSTIGDAFNEGVYVVNSSTGSDETGDGSDERPFASLAFLMGPSFPKVINSKIVIKVVGSVSVDEMILHQEIGSGGSLSIVGGSNPTVVTTSQGAGPFTLTGVTQQGTPVVFNDLGVADTFSANELYGKWLLFLDGDCQGQAVPIHDNAASNIYTRGGLDGTPAIGDTFQVVTPTDTIVCPKWDIEIKGGQFGEDSAESRFNIYNLNIDIRSATYDSNNFRLANSVDSQMSFVTHISESDQFSHLTIESNLNNSPAFDVDAVNSSTSEVVNQQKPTGASNAGLLVYRDSFPPASFSFSEVIIRHAEIVQAVDCGGRMTLKANIGQLNNIAAGVVRIENGSSGGIYVSYISGNASGAAIHCYFGGSVSIQNNYLQAGQDAIEIEQAAVEVSGNIHGTFTGHGFRFGRGFGYVASQEDPSGWVGTTGAIYFAGGVGTTAFPAADARVTDTIANFYARIETT